MKKGISLHVKPSVLGINITVNALCCFNGDMYIHTHTYTYIHTHTHTHTHYTFICQLDLIDAETAASRYATCVRSKMGSPVSYSQRSVACDMDATEVQPAERSR